MYQFTIFTQHIFLVDLKSAQNNFNFASVSELCNIDTVHCIFAVLYQYCLIRMAPVKLGLYAELSVPKVSLE